MLPFLYEAGRIAGRWCTTDWKDPHRSHRWHRRCLFHYLGTSFQEEVHSSGAECVYRFEWCCVVCVCVWCYYSYVYNALVLFVVCATQELAVILKSLQDPATQHIRDRFNNALGKLQQYTRSGLIVLPLRQTLFDSLNECAWRQESCDCGVYNVHLLPCFSQLPCFRALCLVCFGVFACNAQCNYHGCQSIIAYCVLVCYVTWYC